VATSSEDDEAPREFIERRLASLRRTYGLSDAEAREQFESGQAPELLDFTEWMVLLGESRDTTDDEQ